jgi:hypothetical protein
MPSAIKHSGQVDNSYYVVHCAQGCTCAVFAELSRLLLFSHVPRTRKLGNHDVLRGGLPACSTARISEHEK